MAEHPWGNHWHKFYTLVADTETKRHGRPWGLLRCECGETKEGPAHGGWLIREEHK